ncbi:GNAT family N-acetyltransferase [Microterricola viridarii]|uniref:GNAT family acetyltransferase n=1 Tax=Microterricola viridarii TaxID=412690 RepID=A0A0Y0N2H0_9MICO|nr:GNAT family protein [Microterricola viridarii]AMB58182.1 GNAT family acetyltransferase [Microterricola viridarii]
MAGFVPRPDPRPADTAWPEMSWPVPGDTVLRGRLVELATGDAERDAAELFTALDDDAVWTHVAGRPRTIDDAAQRLRAATRPTRQQWTMRTLHEHRGLPAGSVIGSTSLIDVQPENASLEIGSTTYAPAVWAGPVNPETKLLLLGYAFDTLGAGRVQLKTDIRNTRSQRAIERLGARYEGVLRRHMRRDDGTVRDTVMFSIIAEEWPEVRSALQKRVDAAVAAEQGSALN